jgi:hypothetical protein
MIPWIKANWRAVRKVALAALILFGLFFVSVSAILAIGRHMEDGRLQWLRGSPTALAALEAYKWRRGVWQDFPVWGLLLNCQLSFGVRLRMHRRQRDDI